MRVGIFGGTFNPIHFGHLRSAEVIREAFQLDRLYFVPAARPPHKEEEHLAPAHHRLRMVELAVAENPFFAVSTVELEREGKSYSVDTIRHFLAVLRSEALFFILGIDAFLAIHTWKDYAAIPELCHVIVTSRPGIVMPPKEAFLPVALRTAFWYDTASNVYRHKTGHIIVSYEIDGLNISASTIRDKVRRHKSVRYLMPAAVESYMAEHALYQPRGVLR
jgi:nicotinate-nucleotide adenylyltransferase